MANIFKRFLGVGHEKMPNFAFHMMNCIYKVCDLIFPIVKNNIRDMNIKEGMTVIDYACGPGRYISKISKIIGENGKLYAVDIHEMAIEKVNKKIKKNNLTNVKTVLVTGYNCDLEDNTADVIYALDVFHMIENPKLFLAELKRLLKDDGILFISEGHQKRELAKDKILASNLFEIKDEFSYFLKCIPS